MPLKDKEAHRQYLRDRYKDEPEHRQRVKARSKAHYWANRDKHLARKAERSRTDPEYRRAVADRGLKSRTGADLETKERLLKEQDDKCGCCGDPLGGPKGRCLDHDHRTMKIRAVLCSPCNIALGMAQDGPQRLRKMIAYLRKHSAA